MCIYIVYILLSENGTNMKEADHITINRKFSTLCEVDRVNVRNGHLHDHHRFAMVFGGFSASHNSIRCMDNSLVEFHLLLPKGWSHKHKKILIECI